MEDEKIDNNILFADDYLLFANQNVECIPAWLATKYGNIAKKMDLSYNRLRTIKGLVGFTQLTELILDNNQLTDDLRFGKNESLETLTLNKNNIKTLDLLMEQCSENLPNITYLSLLGNEACPNQLIDPQNDETDYQRYRYYVLSHLPKLKFLDSSCVTDEERKEAKRVGPYMKVISTVITHNENDLNSANTLGYKPLPTSLGETEAHRKSTFGKCRYVYYGKQSEGNRFIANNDL